MEKHSESVVAAITHLKWVEAGILDVGIRLMKSADGHIFIFDQFAIATLNRAVAISSAFHKLVNDFNMVAAGALVRIHLDTALRYFASHLVDNCDAFAESVLRGEPIHKMVDRNGNKLNDFHLSNEFEKQVPGIRNLYERACGYVHFSGVHVARVLDGVVDRENFVIGTKIGATDRGLSDDYYIDACNTVSEISKIIINLVESWIDYKTDQYASGAANTT
ncbi:MAG TPA: hypothetical protein PKK23_09910 [Nitrospirales bacterium]|nr:hypothetical protein [Nitrospirales bacterium]